MKKNLLMLLISAFNSRYYRIELYWYYMHSIYCNESKSTRFKKKTVLIIIYTSIFETSFIIDNFMILFTKLLVGYDRLFLLMKHYTAVMHWNFILIFWPSIASLMAFYSTSYIFIIILYYLSYNFMLLLWRKC